MSQSDHPLYAGNASPFSFSEIALTDFLVFKHGPALNLFLLFASLTAAVLLAAAKPPMISCMSI